MKMVKTLLLGTAAGFVAVAGAQAADMPVKAAAVQYVKICNLYGDGFWYLPGTNICVKIGGYVRAEYGYWGGTSMTNGPYLTGSTASGAVSDGYSERFDGHDFIMRSRAYISMDTREQTEYGVLRTYLNIGVNFDSPAAGSPSIFSGNRAFVQFAGFTVGLAQSFFDFYSVPISQYWGITPASDTGDGGWKVAAFTAQFGNGITSTVSLEEPRRISIVNTNTGADPFVIYGAGANTNDYIKIRYPDIVSNWRIDQAWGSAQIMFAAHDASAAYYFPGAGGIGVPVPVCPPAVVPATGTEVCGHPADKMGWAAGIGSKHNVPGLGDYFQWQFTYAKGATRYVDQTQTGSNFAYFNGGTLGVGWLTDGIVNGLTGEVRLTTAYGVNAAYDHLWTKRFRTSLYGSYMKIEYDDVANTTICAVESAFATAGSIGGPGVSAGSPGGIFPGISNCQNNWSFWSVGSRTQYNFTPAMYVGFDVIYTQLVTADRGLVLYNQLAGTQKPTSVYAVNNQDNVAFRVRFHRDILP